jgi:hypothetical protein
MGSSNKIRIKIEEKDTMPATIKTKEVFPVDTRTERLDEEVKLRIKAGAIKSWYEKESNQLVLYTEWNVIGEQ